jgi:hypothetical protein
MNALALRYDFQLISFCLLSADHLVLVVLQRELEEIWRDAVGVAATVTAAAQAQDSFWML